MFILLLSSVGHDLKHPGYNNGFLVNSNDPIAIKYNDNSVLENFHAANLFKILRFQNCNILVNFDKE